jgi:hypothetical protein
MLSYTGAHIRISKWKYLCLSADALGFKSQTTKVNQACIQASKIQHHRVTELSHNSSTHVKQTCMSRVGTNLRLECPILPPELQALTIKLQYKITITIIIIIIIIIYHLYAWHLKLYIWNKPCFWGTWCCSYSVVTIYGTCNSLFHDKCFVLLH